MKILTILMGCVAFVSTLQVQVEPLVFLMAACNSARSTVLPQLSQEKMERTYEAPEGLNGTALRKFYNKKMVRWDQYYDYINMPLSSILGIFYGAYSDRMGRKIPMLIGMSSVAVDTAFRMLVLGGSTDWSLYFILIDAGLTSFLGNFALFMSAMNAYMADLFPVKKTLSKRMVFVSVLFSCGSLFGSLLTKYLVKRVSPIKIMLSSQCCVVVAVLYAVAVLETRKPVKKSPLLTTEEQPEGEAPRQRKSLTPLGVMRSSVKSLADSVKIFLVPREGHRRCFLYLSIIAGFLDQFVFGEEKSLVGTYTRLAPFNWDTSAYALYNSIRPIAQIAGMFFGLIVLKQFLKLSDTLLITLAIVSMGLCALVIGMAQSSWLIYASIGAGCLHGLLNPLTLTFISCLVAPDEIGKVFAINAIAGKLAGIAQTSILNNIYIATVVWWQGFVWILMAGISGVAALIFAFIHFVAKKEELVV